MGFVKEKSYYSTKQKKKHLQLFATKLTEKIPDPHNAKENHQSFLRKKHPKPTESPNIADIKLVTIEYPKTFHKLFKTIRQAKKVGAGKNPTSPLYSDAAKCKT